MVNGVAEGRSLVLRLIRVAGLALALVAPVAAFAQTGAVFDPAAPRRGPLPTRLPGQAAPPPVRPAYPIQAQPAPPRVPAPVPVQARPAPLVPGVADPTTLRPDQIAVLIRALQDAPSHGFEPGAFPIPTTGIGQQRQLTATVLAYARAVRSGRLQASGFRSDWGMRPAAYDPTLEFQNALRQDRLAEWLAGLPPPYVGYETLQDGLRNYRAMQDRGGWAPVPAGKVLKVGVTDPRVAALRARLAAEDSATPAATLGAEPVFDEPLAEAVRRAQRRFGLAPTGQVGGPTLAALNTPVATRIGQIVANMERWRWLPRELPGDRIQVNIAAAVLTVFNADAPTMSMRAVTGRPGDETPMLMSTIDSIVLNPPWNVPAGIAAKELWPKGQAYLARNGFKAIPTGGGTYRLQQQAGPQSALGRVKFDFPNPYAVYLHDTPSQARFDSFSRLASHGCVRVQRPVELAKAVLAGDPVWTPETIDATIAGGETVRAPLSRPIAVYLLYWTAYMGVDGQMNFRDDPYGWDALLLQRIAAGGSRQA